MTRVDLDPELAANFSVADRVAIVTGGARGLGAEIARTLHLAGATVVLADLAGADPKQTAEAIAQGSGRAHGHHCDVTDRASVHDLVESVVAEHGRLDIMVNNAGVIANNSVLDTTEEEFDRVMAVNLKGVLFGCQAAVGVMAPHGRGAIVNMASQAADSPAPGIVSYAVSKAGVVQLTRTLALEVADKGIRVNAVAPGFTPTPMTNRHFTRSDGTIDNEAREQVWGAMRDLIPMRVLGEPRDQALAVLYLVSDAARFVTGQVLRPNGGGWL